MAAINYQFIPTPTSAVQGEHKLPRTVLPIFTFIIGRMSIPGWKLNKADVCNQCGISMRTCQRAFAWLVAHGYMAYDLIKKWQVFPVPVPPTKNNTTPKAKDNATCSPCPATFGIDDPDKNGRVIYKESFNQIEEQQPVTPVQPIVDAIVEPSVVVSPIDGEKLVYPEQLNPDQKREARHKLKKLQQPELQQPVLFALAYYMAQGVVKSPIAYLDGIVKRANNGTFTAVQPHTATKTPTASDRVEETRKRLDEAKNLKVDNASFFEALKNKFGAKAAAAIPV